LAHWHEVERFSSDAPCIQRKRFLTISAMTDL
jgi:hypothetical protein